MKKILSIVIVLTLSIPFISGADIPEKPNPQRMVNDYVGLLSSAERQELENKLVNFNDQTSTQIAVVIVNTLNGDSPFQYATEIGEKWGVGQKGFDNGFVVLIKEKTATSKGEAFIATGYGVEGLVPDAVAKRIIENEMIPNFKKGAYYKGIDQATDRLIELTKGEFTAQTYMKKTNRKEGLMGLFMGMAVFLFIILNLFGRASAMRRRSMGRSNLPFWILLGMLGSGSRNSGGFDNFSSGGGSFGGGGGFGGFGGGGFGGGGAGGSW